MKVQKSAEKASSVLNLGFLLASLWRIHHVVVTADSCVLDTIHTLLMSAIPSLEAFLTLLWPHGWTWRLGSCSWCFAWPVLIVHSTRHYGWPWVSRSDLRMLQCPTWRHELNRSHETTNERAKASVTSNRRHPRPLDLQTKGTSDEMWQRC